MIRSESVVARRVQEGWELHAEGLEPLYTRRLEGAAERAREAMAAARGVDPASLFPALRVELGGQLDAGLRATVQAQVDAHKAQVKASAHLRRMAAQLKEQGLTGRDTARVLNVSPQRVSQLMQSDSPQCSEPACGTCRN